MKLLRSNIPAVRKPESSTSYPNFTFTGRATFGGIIRAEMRVNNVVVLRSGDTLILECKVDPEDNIAGLVIKRNSDG